MYGISFMRKTGALITETFSKTGRKLLVLPCLFFTFCPSSFFNCKTLFYLHLIPTLFKFPTLSIFYPPPYFTKFSSFSDLINSSFLLLNFSFFIFQIFKYPLQNEVTRYISSFFFLHTLINVKNLGQYMATYFYWHSNLHLH